MLRKTYSLIFFLLVTLISFSQEQKKYGLDKFRSFSVDLGLAFPSLDFSKENYADAALGFGLQVRYFKPINPYGLGLIGQVGLFLNDNKIGFDNSFKKDLDNITGLNGLVQSGYPAFTSVPFTLGIAYQHDISKIFSLIGDIGVIYNFMIVDDLKYTSGNFKADIITRLGMNPGFKIKAGALYKKFLEFSLSFYYLGNYNLDTEISFEDTSKKNSLPKIEDNFDFNNVGITYFSMGLHIF